MSDFPSFRKIPRLHKSVVITEKIDGTNALIHIRDEVAEPTLFGDLAPGETRIFAASPDGETNAYVIRAGSRNRWITPEDDNHGFAKWVQQNATQLTQLGVGHHYGEWYGAGIQRGYGLADKRFALFNVARWFDPRDENLAALQEDFPNAVPCPEVCTVVPVLRVDNGNNLNNAVLGSLMVLSDFGSWTAPGFKSPEGIVVYHLAAGQYFKVLLEGDGTPKSLQGWPV